MSQRTSLQRSLMHKVMSVRSCLLSCRKMKPVGFGSKAGGVTRGQRLSGSFVRFWPLLQDFPPGCP